MSTETPTSRRPPRPVPPVLPDPELIDHIEGNRRIIEKDKAAARAYLEDLRERGLIPEDFDFPKPGHSPQNEPESPTPRM